MELIIGFGMVSLNSSVEQVIRGASNIEEIGSMVFLFLFTTVAALYLDTP